MSGTCDVKNCCLSRMSSPGLREETTTDPHRTYKGICFIGTAHTDVLMNELRQVSQDSSDELYYHTTEKSEGTVSDSGIDDDDLGSCITAKTPRVQLILEFIETETSYVSILDTIVNIEKIAKDAKRGGGPLLNPAEVKSIFFGIESIQRLHHALLGDLVEKSHQLEECFPIGQILLKHAPEILKAYPPFVNYFESAQEALQCCDCQNARFHDYLESCKNKPECGRQSLRELMIRPVQRLGSIVLLVKSIMKHTDKNNTDYLSLEEALSKIMEAVSSIDKDKGRTQNMHRIFDIFNSIEECPPNLVSSSRYILLELEVIDVNGFEKFGHHFMLFIFSDLIEVSKAKMSTHQSLPKCLELTKRASGMVTGEKNLKHYKIIPFSEIRAIIDFADSERVKGSFGILSRDDISGEENVMCFALTQAEATKKDEYILQLCEAIAVSRCIKDPMSILYEVDPCHLDIKQAEKDAYSISAKAREVLKYPINHAINLCKAGRKITMDVSQFLRLQDSLKTDAKSSSCTELLGTKKSPDVVRSFSLTSKIIKKL